MDLFVEKTGKIRTDMVPILDAAVDQLELGAFQEQTDLRPADNHEAKFLRMYKEEQEQLRRDAAQLLNEGNVCRQEYFRLTKQLTQQLRQLDEQHKAALRQADEQHKAAMLPVESQLQSVNKKLDGAMTKIYARAAEEKERLQVLLDSVESKVSAYRGSYNAAQHPLTPDEYKTMVRTAHMSTAATDGTGDKFLSNSKDLIVGEFEHAAGGTGRLLCIDEDELSVRMNEGFDAMREEVRALGNSELEEYFDYVVNQVASEKEYAQGIRDKGRAGKSVDDFLQDRRALDAELKRPEFVALRIYTLPIFWVFNDPMRNRELIRHKQPHPLPVTVSFIVRGLKKLRIVDASSDQATRSMMLWRGMKNVRVTEEFVKRGGTELAPMSTTADLAVAVDYGLSKNSLIFKIVTENKLQRGADVAWLSAFPNESEILFAPLTYMQPTGKS